MTIEIITEPVREREIESSERGRRAESCLVKVSGGGGGPR